MSVRQMLIPVLANLRTNVIGGVMGLRMYQVWVRTETASDSRGGLGATVSNVDVLLGETPKIRPATRSDIDRVTAAGHIHNDLYRLEKVTPRNDANTVGTLIGSIHQDSPGVGTKKLIVLVGDGMPAYVPYSVNPVTHVVTTPTGGGEYTVVEALGLLPFELQFLITPRTGKR